MLGSLSNMAILKYDWQVSKPILRYVLGISFVMVVTSLMNYPLAYLTTVLALGYIAPGTKPLTFKQGVSFLIALIVINLITVLFSAIFIDYPLVLMPLLCLGILWLYYTDKLPMMVKVFAIISVFVIPLLSLESNELSGFIAVSLIFNAFMAIILTQLVFRVFPWSAADEVFVKAKQKAVKQSENERFRYALNILLIVLPVLILFFAFKLFSSLIVLIFIGILSMSPVLANAKVGTIMIVANILGGIFAIVAYKLLVMVPLLSFMLLLTLIVGFLFGRRLFSKHKFAPIFGTAFSTFLLILGSVTSSDDAAGEAVWSRVVQIAIAVIYVVIAFGLVNHFSTSKKEKTV